MTESARQSSQYPDFPPYDPLGLELNCAFHNAYKQRLRELVLSFGQAGGRPVMVALNDDVLMLHDGRRREAQVRPASYHQLKALAHAFFARALGDSNPELEPKSRAYLAQVVAELPAEAADIARRIPATLQPGADLRLAGELMEQAFVAAARIELQGLHRHVSPWWQELNAEQRAACGIVVVTSHQSRVERLNIQFFEALTGRATGVGAQNEDGFVVLEGDVEFDEALEHLARHYLDQEMSEKLFGNRYRLQIDLLAPGARAQLPTILSSPA